MSIVVAVLLILCGRQSWCDLFLVADLLNLFYRQSACCKEKKEPQQKDEGLSMHGKGLRNMGKECDDRNKKVRGKLEYETGKMDGEQR